MKNQHVLAGVLTLVWFTGTLCRAWEPGTENPEATGNPSQPVAVDTADRNDVVSFYHCIFSASEGAAAHIDWTGSLAGCDPGTTSQAFRDDILRRVNYFRAMAGVPGDILFSPNFDRDAQAAALIMAEHSSLSHYPAETWGVEGCWSPEGQNGARSGNLNLGNNGPSSIVSYMRDEGPHNAAVGHRRWILYANTTLMGTGDVPQVGSFPFGPGEHPATNCLYVIDSENHRPEEATFAAWPPQGHVPAEQIYQRWSLQFNSPSFGYPRYDDASVSMRLLKTGETIPVRIDHRDTGGPTSGDPAIVWVPDWSGLGGSFPVEEPIEITVASITSGDSGAPGIHTYTVTAINPDVITETLDLSGPSQASTSDASYSFDPLSGVGADSYELEVAPAEANALWIEGAEDSPSPRVEDATSGSYALRIPLTPLYDSPGAYGGSQAFHLTFPDISETTQMFEIDRTVIPRLGSQLQFYELFRWASLTSRLGAEISVDGGAWTEVWSRAGNGATNTTGWLNAWTRQVIDLSMHAGKSLRVRFRYTGSQSIFIGTDPGTGVFIDDVTVTNADQLGTGHMTALPGNAHAFTLDEETAGAPLEADDIYFLRLRPILGCKTFPFGPLFKVTIGGSAPQGYAAWMAANYPEISASAFDEDSDRDGIPNGAEYAFGLHPASPDTLPPMQYAGGSWQLSFNPEILPYETSTLIYGAEFSENLQDWTPLEDSDPGPGFLFVLHTATRGFARWTVMETP